MKKLYTIIIMMILQGGFANAQNNLLLEEHEINLKDGRFSAWVFPISFDLEEALDDLKDYCKDRSDVKMKKGGDNLIIAEKVSIPSIITKRGDLIGFGFAKDNYNGIALIFRLGYDISINSKEWTVEMNNFRSYAKAFMSYQYEHSYTTRIEAKEKEIKLLNKQINQNEKKILNMNKKIERLNEKISKESDNVIIEGLKRDLSTLELDIQRLSDPIPQLNSQIGILEGNVSELKKELNACQVTIGAI